MKRLTVIIASMALAFTSFANSEDAAKGKNLSEAQDTPDWVVTDYAVKESGIRMDISSRKIQASVSLLLYSNKEQDAVKDELLKLIRKGVQQETAKYIGGTDVHKWAGYKYITGDDDSIYAHLSVVVPCGGKRVLLTDFAVPVGSIAAKVNWNKIIETWVYNYNTWVTMLAQRR